MYEAAYQVIHTARVDGPAVGIGRGERRMEDIMLIVRSAGAVDWTLDLIDTESENQNTEITTERPSCGRASYRRTT